MSNKSDMLYTLKSSKLPVVICGAGIVGEVLFSVLSEAGVAVEAFCDSSVKAAGGTFCGREVIYTPDLKARYGDALLVISVAAIKDVVDLVRSLGFTNWLAGGLLLKDIGITQTNADASIDYRKFAIENCILCHDGYLNPDRVFLRSIDLIVTERCSLKCRDCSNLMQYYEHPRDCDLDMLMSSIDSLLAVVDEVMDFRVIGGDAFMYRQWPAIVRRLAAEPKARRVVVYTNGSIAPGDEEMEALVHEKAIVIVTDYGELSRNLPALIDSMSRKGIFYHVLKVTEWLDCSAIARQHRSAEHLRELYKLCCAKNMLTLSDGKLFRCPYAANASRLGAVPDYSGDYVDILEPFPEETVSSLKERVRSYVLGKDYLETCDFCKGRPLSGEEVPPALQVKTALYYQKYERN